MTLEVVFDASVAVKWIRDDAGSADALSLLRAHLMGELHAWLPEQCAAELLAVARRDPGVRLLC